MAMKVTAISNTEFYNKLHDFLVVAEGRKPLAYLDSAGIPTIGLGYNLIDEDVRNIVFKEMGIALDSPTATALTTAIDANTGTGKTTAGLQSALKAAFGNKPFAMTDTQIDNVFATASTTYVAQAKEFSGLGYSNELVALSSLAYNGLLHKSPSLKQAIANGDRAKAYFEIRYNSNKLGNKVITGAALTADEQGRVAAGEDRGLAKRRYGEAELFGLYHDAANVTAAERDQIRNMFLINRNQIAGYEATYGQNPDGSAGRRGDMITAVNRDFSLSGAAQVDTLRQALTPAGYAALADFNTNTELQTLDKEQNTTTPTRPTLFDLSTDPANLRPTDPSALGNTSGGQGLLGAGAGYQYSMPSEFVNGNGLRNTAFSAGATDFTRPGNHSLSGLDKTMDAMRATAFGQGGTDQRADRLDGPHGRGE